METVRGFILGGSQISLDGDCTHEVKRCLPLGRKAMTNLNSIFKSRDMTLPTEVCLVKAMVFLVVMYGWESWTIKKAEHRRIDAFELWCWRSVLRVPWTARRSNYSILKEISPEFSLEGLMLKLKFQYFGHLMWRADSPVIVIWLVSDLTPEFCSGYLFSKPPLLTTILCRTCQNHVLRRCLCEMGLLEIIHWKKNWCKGSRIRLGKIGHWARVWHQENSHRYQISYLFDTKLPPKKLPELCDSKQCPGSVGSKPGRFSWVLCKMNHETKI